MPSELPSPLSRREFLKIVLMGLGVAACNQVDTPSSPTPLSLPTTPFTPTPSNTPLHTASPSFTATESLPEPTLTPEPAYTSQPTSTPTPSLKHSFVIDAHQDIAWNALEFGRDTLQSVYITRMQEMGTDTPRRIGQCTSALPEWLIGRLGIIFATLFVMPARYAYPGYDRMVYSTSEQAEALAREQLAYYQGLVDHEPRLRLIRTIEDLESLIQVWSDNNAPENTAVGLVVLMEGADPIVDPSDLAYWFESGLRIVGPAWKATRYAGGTSEPGPLTDLGHELLDMMSKLNMILDLSHLAEQAYLEAVDIYPGPLIASHSNPRTFSPGDRGLSDEMIKKLADRDGVMGVVLYNIYLRPGWQQGDSRLDVTLETVANVIDFVTQLVGSSQHVAIGSDFDGGFGLDSTPSGIDSAADLVKIAAVLERRGYLDEDINAVMMGNWLRILRRGLPSDDS